MNYSLYHVEQYGHGNAESNTLKDEQKVTIENNDGHFDVYECESESEAQKIANWYLDAVYGSYPSNLQIVKHNPRYFAVIDAIESFQVSYTEDPSNIFMEKHSVFEGAAEQANILLNEGKTPAVSVYVGDSCTEILELEDWGAN
jgi:hypothetical protein